MTSRDRPGVTAQRVRFRRFVALGDSQTEGVGDEPNPDGTARGWADRFAVQLAQDQGDLLYANLAVRGCRVREVLEQQVPAALGLEPDLASAIVGVNDVIRPRFSLAQTVAGLEAIHRSLTGQGAVVLSATIPDISVISPAARLIRGRLCRFNDAVRAISNSHGGILIDLEHWPEVADPGMWCADRLHLSPAGHMRLADAASGAVLGREVAPLPARMASDPQPAWRFDREIGWVVRYLAPWALRRVTGRSSGDGRIAKRPNLGPIGA